MKNRSGTEHGDREMVYRRRSVTGVTYLNSAVKRLHVSDKSANLVQRTRSNCTSASFSVRSKKLDVSRCDVMTTAAIFSYSSSSSTCWPFGTAKAPSSRAARCPPRPRPPSERRAKRDLPADRHLFRAGDRRRERTNSRDPNFTPPAASAMTITVTRLWWTLSSLL